MQTRVISLCFFPSQLSTGLTLEWKDRLSMPENQLKSEVIQLKQIKRQGSKTGLVPGCGVLSEQTKEKIAVDCRPCLQQKVKFASEEKFSFTKLSSNLFSDICSAFK